MLNVKLPPVDSNLCVSLLNVADDGRVTGVIGTVTGLFWADEQFMKSPVSKNDRKRVFTLFIYFLICSELPYTPRRILAIFACVEKADAVAVRVFEIAFTPQPTLVYRFLFKYETEIF